MPTYAQLSSIEMLCVCVNTGGLSCLANEASCGHGRGHAGDTQSANVEVTYGHLHTFANVSGSVGVDCSNGKRDVIRMADCR